MSKRQVEELNSLERQRRNRGGLGSAKARQSIPAESSVSTSRGRQVGESASLASPLTETARTVTAHSDGTHDYYVAVQSTMEDANGVEHTINWLQPDSPNITVV